jgi:nitroimidazol reductase NimA-like FMN-containing flavoprotein (pyridoxamine 5'-phosphate oxidase superfamily)
MPSRREVIRMTPAEIRAYLEAQRRIIVVTNGPGGLPHPVPMNYGIDDAGRIIITCFRKSQKVKNLERDPRAALLVENGATYGELQSVIAYADAEIIADPAGVRDNLRFIRSKEELSGSLSPEMRGQVQASFAKRVVVRFTPFRYVSWDHRKLGQSY